MEAGYPCTIHAPWKVGTLVQSMVHGDHVPYLLLYNPCPMEAKYPCTIHAPWKVGTLVQSMVHGTRVPYLLLYNPWFMAQYPCTMDCTRVPTSHGAWIVQGYS